jgi:membrane fusion protein, copper/silver efflux system
MKKKSILLYILTMITGITLGWLMFGGNSNEKHDHSNEVAQAQEYTCSMHPQIRQDGPGKCPLCGMDLTPVSKTGGQSSPFVIEMTESAMALGNIQTTKVKSANAAHEMNLTGKVSVNEQNISTLTAKFPGRIERLYINFEGQEVKRGQRLASIYSPELINAQRELLEAKKIRQVSPELYEAAKEKLRLWKLSESQIAQIENAEEVTSTFDIYAEASGVVSKRQVAVGDYVSTGTVMAEISDLSSLWIVLDVYETELALIKVGNVFSFIVPSVPGREFNATVSYINPVLNAETRSVDVRAEFKNTGNLLKPEMLVNAKLKTKTDNSVQGLAIPATAVLWTGKRSVVYVKQKMDVPAFERREITLGARMGDLYIVEKGLEFGEEVVFNGVFAVDASAQLSGNYSMMSSPEVKSIEVPEAFRKQLTQVAEKYFVIKNALVKSNVIESQKAVPGVTAALKEVDMKLLDSQAHDLWMPLLQAMQQGAKGIAEGNNIEAQRESFQLLSDHLIEAVELFSINLDVSYRAYCPMAFDDTGAYWLSEIKDIKNPYFGDAMLSCGENRTVYKKGDEVFKH